MMPDTCYWGRTGSGCGLVATLRLRLGAGSGLSSAGLVWVVRIRLESNGWNAAYNEECENDPHEMK